MLATLQNMVKKQNIPDVIKEQIKLNEEQIQENEKLIKDIPREDSLNYKLDIERDTDDDSGSTNTELAALTNTELAETFIKSHIELDDEEIYTGLSLFTPSLNILNYNNIDNTKNIQEINESITDINHYLNIMH